MPGKISFHFDDGHLSHHDVLMPLFREFDAVGCIALLANKDYMMGFEKAMEMQDAGWEILCHTREHTKMSEPVDEEIAEREIIGSRKILEDAGFRIRQFVTPCSTLSPVYQPLVQSVYDAAFTRYTRATELPVEKLVIERPVNRYDLHRCGLAGKTIGELKAYIDYVKANDEWIVFYDHDIGVKQNITADNLRALLAYIREQDVPIMTSSEALDAEKCRTKVIYNGYDGKECFVHARGASDGKDKMLITTQKLNVQGSDDFEILHTKFSHDGGRSWTEIVPDETFKSVYDEKYRTCCCDMTPLWHKKTGKFIVTGHTVDYIIGEIVPVSQIDRHRVVPYSVFNDETGKFGELHHVEMPDPVKYCDCGSGCSQCLELENGDLLIPISFREKHDGIVENAKASVMRCTFDGETLACAGIGNDLEVKDEVRGIGECSVAFANGKYLLTIRGDTHGYVSVSDDGLHYTQPVIWTWDDGEILPTYNTQSHFFKLGEKLYLVYTRKNGHNDHVFRNRAPLYAAEVDTDKLCVKRDTEFVVVPERGARLGNFGAFQINENEARVIVAEWMQPRGCEKYGSDNSMWLTDIKKQEN